MSLWWWLFYLSGGYFFRVVISTDHCGHIPAYSYVMLQERRLNQHPQSVSMSTRIASVTVLPESGADISAAGQTIVGILGHHLDNLAPSEISP